MPDFPVIPGYKIEKELGRGGMARVYLAHEEKLERHVALKVLSLFTEEGRPLAERFIKEAKTSARLHHSYIITIHDVGQSGNLYYMAVEYLPGGTLKERLKRAALPPAEALQILGHLAEALEYAHGQGFVHRDIKPENVMFRSDGRTVLTDFGIARAVGSTTRMTKTGQSIGTPHYMSPEQARGQTVDGRSDIYSLGILLHEMLTGCVPYDAEDSVAVVIQHLQDPIPTLPAPLFAYQALLAKMMAKDPGQRFQNCRELLVTIEGFSSGAIHGSSGKSIAPESFSSSRPATKKPPTSGQMPGFVGAIPPVGDKHESPSFFAPTEKKRAPMIPWLVGALVVLVVILFAVLSNQKPDSAVRAYDDTPHAQEPITQPQVDDSEKQRMRDQLAAAEAEKKRLAAALKENEDQERERLATEARQLAAQNEQQRLARLEEQNRKSLEATRLREETAINQTQEEEQKQKVDEAERLRAEFKANYLLREETAINQKQEEEQKQKVDEAERLRAEFKAAHLRENAQKRETEETVQESARSILVIPVNLRSSYRTLSNDDAMAMLKRLNLFDKEINYSAIGIKHQYESQNISGDQVVVDRATGLMWHQSGSERALGYYSFDQWLNDLNRRGYAGYSDWRLPTLEEGASLLESNKKNGDLYIDSIFSNKQEWIWTGDNNSSNFHWLIRFSKGRMIGYRHGFSYDSYYIRPVRSVK